MLDTTNKIAVCACNRKFLPSFGRKNDQIMCVYNPTTKSHIPTCRLVNVLCLLVQIVDPNQTEYKTKPYHMYQFHSDLDEVKNFFYPSINDIDKFQYG